MECKIKDWIRANKEWIRERFDENERRSIPNAFSLTKSDVADRIGLELGTSREAVELFFDEFDIHAILFL